MILRRVAAVPVVIVVIILLGFLITNVLPGNPAELRAGQYATSDVIERTEAALGLDEPWYTQLRIYTTNLVQGDFGENSLTGLSVAQDLDARWPATVELTLVGFILGLVVGLPLGIMAGLRSHGPWDHAGRLIAVAGVSVPVFWVGLLLIYFFYAKLGWAAPPTGRAQIGTEPEDVTGFYLLDSVLTADPAAFWSSLKSLILPAITLALLVAAPVARIARSSVLEVRTQEYVTMAIASGLPRGVVLRRWILRNALLPVVTMMGILLGYLIGGNILVEIVFAWPGLGGYAFESISNNDFAPVQAFIIVTALAILLISLVLDVVYAWLNPRIRYAAVED
jgi:ABC-type dipeptide/oligopeptide/nickel transport system permease component